MKKVCNLLLLALCCLLLVHCTPEKTTVKFLNYNIRNGLGMDNIRDLERTAQVIRRMQPDLVALEEVDSATQRMGQRDVARELASMTGLHPYFCRAINFSGGSYGVALLSRTEPLVTRRIPLPGREEARTLLMAEFPDYIVCVTHLTLTSEDQPQALALIRSATDTCRKPLLLAGDFNMERADTLALHLGREFRFLSDTCQLTYPSDLPKIRIDYILGRGLPASTQLTERGVDYTTQASDHCPQWVSLCWKK